MVPDSPKKIDTASEEQRPKMLPAQEEVVISDQLVGRDDFMPLGGGARPEEKRKLLNRPVFPYARLSYLLPSRDILVEFSLDVSPAGEVISVNILSSSGVEELDRELLEWVKKWEYQPASSKSSLTTSIEIPA
jgi:TonB family protein